MQTFNPSSRLDAHDYKYPQNTSPAPQINEGHKVADFYSATTTATRSRFCGPILRRVLQHEIAAAFASSIPLYEGLRPLQESAEPYLNFLQEQVAIARGENPSFKGEWVYFFISTKKN